MPYLDWSMLHQGCCPKCSELLEKHSIYFDGYVCVNSDCDFKISTSKYEEITLQKGDFSGFCEECGKKIPTRYRVCRQCS